MSKAEYWKKREEEKEFRNQWYAWRDSCKREFGAGFVAANKHLFTQRMYKEWLVEQERRQREAALLNESGEDTNELEIKTTASE